MFIGLLPPPGGFGGVFVCLFICLFVCVDNNSESIEQIYIFLFLFVGPGEMKK